MSPKSRTKGSERPAKASKVKELEEDASTLPRAPELQDAAESYEAQIRQVDDLYLPIREAAEAELASTSAGARVLKAERALGSELAEVVAEVMSGQTTLAEGARATFDRRTKFRDRYRDAFLDAHRPHARLQPSVEALAELIQSTGDQPRQVWTAEVRPFEAILLTPAATTPDDVGTVQQGLGDPEPAPPVHLCMSPAYARRETRQWTQLFAFTLASANVNGRIFVSAQGAAANGVGGGSTAHGFVGGDVNLVAGHQDYEAVVDVDFNYNASSWAVFGASGCGADILIRIDKGDGSASLESKTSLFWLVSPVAWGNSAAGSGNLRLVVPFRRATSSAGQVRVMVGAAANAGAWAAAAIADVNTSLDVKEICVNSTD